MAQRHRRPVAAALLGLALCSGRPDAPLTLALAGDLSLAREVARVNAQNWPAALAGVRDALRADATVANLESPLTAAPFQGADLDLRAPPQATPALAAFTHLSVENNHAQDGGRTGEAETRAALRRAGQHPVTRTLTVTRVRGVPVAWVAFVDADPSAPALSVLPLGAVREGAKSAGVVVVLAHWGEEYGVVTARQREQARALARAGATLVVGSGPHVLQGHERLEDGRTLVLYSLGNLLLDQPYPAARVGAVVRVEWGRAWTACARPTRYRAGRVELASGEQARWALAELGLRECGK